MIYYIVFLSIFLGGVLEVSGANKRTCHVLFSFNLFLFWALHAFRWTTGTDWMPYWDFFVTSKPFHEYFATQFEMGFALFNYLVGLFTKNYTIYLMIYSFILVFLYKKIAINNGSYFCIVLLFFYATTIFPVRQILALAFVIYSYKYIIDRNFKLFLIFILIATSIHRTAIIFLPVYFISHYRFNNYILILFYITGVILGMMGVAVDWILNFVIKYALGVDGVVVDKIKTYLISNESSERIGIVRFTFSMISNFIWIVLFLYYRKYIKDKPYNVLLNIYFIGLFLNRLFVKSFPDVARISLFFSSSFILLIAMIICQMKPVNRKFFYVIISFYIFSQMMIILNGEYRDLFIPYVSVFSGIERFVY
jgi:hypothetical protein